jgi:large subunit ribosomal protein L19e
VELKAQKKLAAKILGVGVNRVRIDPARSADLETAISRADIRRFIHDGTISARPEKGVSRSRARAQAEKIRKGRARGVGSRKGGARVRKPKKDGWIRTVRPLRAKLRELKEKNLIDAKEYHKLYRMIKGGAFRSKAHLETYLKERGMLRE